MILRLFFNWCNVSVIRFYIFKYRFWRTSYLLLFVHTKLVRHLCHTCFMYFTSFHLLQYNVYISSLCRTVPGYIGSIYAVFGFIINVLFIKIELFGVHLNPYKSLLFHSSKIRNILCWDE